MYVSAHLRLSEVIKNCYFVVLNRSWLYSPLFRKGALKSYFHFFSSSHYSIVITNPKELDRHVSIDIDLA